jgi:hypothetical protein
MQRLTEQEQQEIIRFIEASDDLKLAASEINNILLFEYELSVKLNKIAV